MYMVTAAAILLIAGKLIQPAFMGTANSREIWESKNWHAKALKLPVSALHSSMEKDVQGTIIKLAG